MKSPDNTYIKTGRPEFDDLIPRVKGFLEKDILEMVIDGEKIRGYRAPDAKSVWIRDYSDMMRGFRYFETDLRSVIQHFADTQAVNGRIFDYFTTFPEKLPCERENWTKYVRVPVEADVEFRFIKAVWLAWQSTGDDEWVRSLLPALDRALAYSLHHPDRFDQTRQLVKRPYTIDTWDFAYSAGKHDWLQFQIDKNTFWGIFHGDNSGYYEALHMLAGLYEELDPQRKTPGGEPISEVYKAQAGNIRKRVNEVCWNGTYFTHFVKTVPVTIPGVDETTQLSMANPMSINRGIASHEMAVAIIGEYLSRRQSTSAFAEWFSIDPPFPDGVFGDEKLLAGAYINGGIFPLAGGELARAAFEHGFEQYGVDILTRYAQLIAEKNESWLWYFPDGTPSSVGASTSPDATPTDGWGSSAMLYALVEGLAGIHDRSKLFEKVRLSPRWEAAGVNDADVQLVYPASGATFRYGYHSDDQAVKMQIESKKSQIDFHILLPGGVNPTGVFLNRQPQEFTVEQVEQSRYLNFSGEVRKAAALELFIAANT